MPTNVFVYEGFKANIHNSQSLKQIKYPLSRDGYYKKEK